MELFARLILVVTLVVTATDLAWYFRLRQHPERLTLPWTLAVIAITLLPIVIIFLNMHRRNLF